MKKVALLGCVLAGLSFGLFSFKQQDCLPESGDLLLTFPRSGTNWTIGVLQTLTKRPVRFLHKPTLKEHLGVNRLGFETDESLPVIYRTHTLYKGIKELDQSQFRLLFTLRNYKECIVKEGKYDAEEFLEAFRSNNDLVEQYFDNLRFFDSGWSDPKTKHLLVYEEIISDPEKVVIDLLKFLGESLDGVPNFFENYEEWNQKMLSSYHEQHKDRGPPSNNQPLFHSKSFPKEVVEEVDGLVQSRFPDLFEKYLKRYQEGNIH